MARPTLKLIDALRRTAARLKGGVTYRWTHMGACNCGHLAQTLTTFSREEIHALALQKAGDWGQQAYDYCPDSGYPIDHIIGVMMDAGMTQRDIDALERLSDPRVVKAMGANATGLDRRSRADVVAYMEAWATLLEDELQDEQRRVA